MPKIIPIKELKNTSEISEMCHESKEPIFITKNGYGDMVIMSMEAYERAQFMHTVYERLDLSERDSKEGKRKEAFQALEEMRSKYGL